jgi:hypothetical protein
MRLQGITVILDASRLSLSDQDAAGTLSSQRENLSSLFTSGARGSVAG